MHNPAAAESLRIDFSNLSPEEAIAHLLKHAIATDISDVFLATNENHVAILARHYGILRQLSVLPTDTGRRYIAHVKAIAGMDVAEHRRPQDGRWVYRDGDKTADLRLNIIPTIHGQDLCIRILLRSSTHLNVEALGMPSETRNDLLSLISAPDGLLLVTGPTGSGKTTTLYACLQHLNDGTRKIHTIEDPIEYTLPGIRQSQVNEKHDLDFAELLRNILRQAPDVIMIGEIRDPATAEIAVRAANSGHLVLATMHAPTAAGAVTSMLGLDVTPTFLASSLRGVIAQRLVRTLCPDCRVAHELSGANSVFDEVRQWLQPGEGDVIYGPGKCDKCFGTGYTGRSGIFETLVVNSQLRTLIGEARPTHEIQSQASATGLIPCRQMALLKVARGHTSVEEVMRAIPAEHLGLHD